ncbi:DUF6349 family protein [Streptomyces jumonjinensis]|uniref:Uncharacterized protein n=1 Tax=Streptomyces jumonjinensis TaxID=1945 RepID=A0A646KVR5_STRJU|nr:DUF6349 family protein [Streptomyces jumonjinensis]MQT05096.1 hypothetical protein [Streptomyces jumonjinensis]
MSILPEPRGARARQTYYWQVRNARHQDLRAVHACETWHIRYGHPGGAYSDLGHDTVPPSHHSPTLLTRRMYGRPGDEYRGGCLSCLWEGRPHTGGGSNRALNCAVEDAHDHAFPGWRDLPVVPDLKSSGSPYGSQRLWRQTADLYPADWLDRGAPRLVRARRRGDAHDPPSLSSPRYELRVASPRRQERADTGDQEVLF